MQRACTPPLTPPPSPTCRSSIPMCGPTSCATELPAGLSRALKGDTVRDGRDSDGSGERTGCGSSDSAHTSLIILSAQASSGGSNGGGGAVGGPGVMDKPAPATTAAPSHGVPTMTAAVAASPATSRSSSPCVTGAPPVVAPPSLTAEWLRLVTGGGLQRLGGSAAGADHSRRSSSNDEERSRTPLPSLDGFVGGGVVAVNTSHVRYGAPFQKSRSRRRVFTGPLTRAPLAARDRAYAVNQGSDRVREHARLYRVEAWLSSVVAPSPIPEVALAPTAASSVSTRGTSTQLSFRCHTPPPLRASNSVEPSVAPREETTFETPEVATATTDAAAGANVPDATGAHTPTRTAHSAASGEATNAQETSPFRLLSSPPKWMEKFSPVRVPSSMPDAAGASPVRLPGGSAQPTAPSAQLFPAPNESGSPEGEPTVQVRVTTLSAAKGLRLALPAATGTVLDVIRRVAAFLQLPVPQVCLKREGGTGHGEIFRGRATAMPPPSAARSSPRLLGRKHRRDGTYTGTDETNAADTDVNQLLTQLPNFNGRGEHFLLILETDA